MTDPLVSRANQSTSLDHSAKPLKVTDTSKETVTLKEGAGEGGEPGIRVKPKVIGD